MNIAIFGDLHGRILLAFWLVKRWQEEHEQVIDHILCVGDAGIYPSYQMMDKASRRFADKYPEERGFERFFLHGGNKGNPFLLKEHPRAAEVFEAVSAHMYFVHGNHECHDFIWDQAQRFAKDSRAPFALDVDWQGRSEGLYGADDFSGWGRLCWLPEGPVFGLDNAWDAALPMSLNLRVINGLDKYTMPQAWEAPKPGSVDVLLSHDVPLGRLKGCHPAGKYDQAGSQRLAEFVDRLVPSWHFFGHMHWPYPEQEIASSWGCNIRSIGMNQLFFENHDSVLTQGAFGVLSLPDGGEAAEGQFAHVEDDWHTGLRYGEVANYL